MYSNGNGVRADSTRAARLFDQACKGDLYAACAELGFMYKKGNGVEKDGAESKRLLQHACDNGYEPACAALGAKGLRLGIKKK